MIASRDSLQDIPQEYFCRQFMDAADAYPEADRVRLAALLDTDGSINICKPYNNPTASFRQAVQRRGLTQWLHATYGGRIHYNRGRIDASPTEDWSVVGTPLATVLCAAYPYLLAKQNQAHIIIRLLSIKLQMPSWKSSTGVNGHPTEVNELKESARQAVSMWNTTNVTDQPATVENIKRDMGWFIEGIPVADQIKSKGWEYAMPLVNWKPTGMLF